MPFGMWLHFGSNFGLKKRSYCFILSICSLYLQAETIYIMSPRPKNIRKVNDMPVAAGFKPIGLNGCCKNTIFLHFEEYEAIRLCDYEMKTQQEASVSMGVSRPTLR